MSLLQRSISAARWTTVSNITRAVTQLAQLIVLTRFLSPQDYGLMAMITVVISYAALFSDMGLSTAFVQRQHISQEERSSLYWLSVSVGGGLMLLLMAVSPLVGYLINDLRLPGLIVLVSTNFFVLALGQQLRMNAEKALDFKHVSVIEIASSISGFVIAVIAAWLGWGVHALVFSAMSNAWLTTIFSWVFLARGWRPLWRFRWLDVSWFVRFGGEMVINNVINHINTTMDVLLGARLLGATQLGIYSLPRNLVLQIQVLVNPIFTRVGFPVIASIQHEKGRVGEVYLKTMRLTASINAPIYVALAVFSSEIVNLLIGEKFQDSAPLLRVLALFGLLRSFYNPAGSLVFGLGRVRLATFWNIGLMFIVPPALWWGGRYGAEGMVWAMVAVMAVLFVPSWMVLVRPCCNVTLQDYSRQVFMPALCAVFSGGFAWLSTIMVQVASIRLIVGFLAGAFSYFLLSWIFNRDFIFLGFQFSRRIFR